MSSVTTQLTTEVLEESGPARKAGPKNVSSGPKPSPFARILGVTLAVVALVYFLGPVWWLIVSSTKSNTAMIQHPGFWFAGDSLGANYDSLMAWTQGLFWRWVGNSMLYSTAAGVAGTLLSVMAGYSLAKFAYPGKKAVLAMVMSGLLLPIALLTVPLYLEFHALGLVDTIWAVIIPSMVSPFGVFLGMVYANSSVPTELIEAARIDGAGEARIFFTIVLRLLAPPMVTIFLFIFVATWNNFLLPLLMISSPELKPVTLGLYGMMSYFSPDKGAVMLGALMGVIPLVILFFALQRYWRSGLAAGSVKG